MKHEKVNDDFIRSLKPKLWLDASDPFANGKPPKDGEKITRWYNKANPPNIFIRRWHKIVDRLGKDLITGKIGEIMNDLQKRVKYLEDTVQKIFNHNVLMSTMEKCPNCDNRHTVPLPHENKIIDGNWLHKIICPHCFHRWDFIHEKEIPNYGGCTKDTNSEVCTDSQKDGYKPETCTNTSTEKSCDKDGTCKHGKVLFKEGCDDCRVAIGTRPLDNLTQGRPPIPKTTGLNFWEAYQAYKSGKRVKRKDDLYCCSKDLGEIHDSCLNGCSEEDLDATDWEVVG